MNHSTHCALCMVLCTFLSVLPLRANYLDYYINRVQPGCGLVLWPDNAAELGSAYNDAVSLEYAYGLPCRVVTGKSADGSIQYNWSWLEAILDGVASRGHQLVLRWRYVYPGSNEIGGSSNRGVTAVPQYIKDLPGYTETYKKVSGDGPTWYPDWSNAELQWFTRQFFADFATAYGSDPRIAFLEVGFGHWAEYHIYGNTLRLGSNFPSKQYQHDFFLHLDSIMPIPWSISIDASDSEYTPFTDSPDLMALTFGTFDDSFMCDGHELGSTSGDRGYNEECWNAFGTNRWHTGVCGGEISYYEDSDQHNFLNPAGMYGHSWAQQAAKYHISFMIANDAPEGSYGSTQHFYNAGMQTGYRFRVVAAESDGVSTTLHVTNTGVAPLYRDAYFALGTTRAPESLRGLLPGDTLTTTIPGVFPTPPVTDDPNIMYAPADPNILHIASDYTLPGRDIQFEASCMTVYTGTALPVHGTSPALRKLFRDGRLLILRGDRFYTPDGRAL